MLTILHSGRETILGTRKGNEWDVFYFNIKYLSYAKKKKKKKKKDRKDKPVLSKC